MPTDYAVLATYSSVTILLTVVATGMYDSALMLDKNDEDAINTAVAAVLITSIITIVSFLAMLFFCDSIAHWAGNENVRFWLYLVPVTVFCSGFYSTLNGWNNRKKRYKRIASNRVIMTAITTSLTLGLGLLHFNERGLLISLIVGQMLAFIILFIQTLNNDRFLFIHISKIDIKKAIHRHRDFPKYNMPQGFIDGLKESSLIWIISNFFGAHVLGSFSFAKSILMRPLQIIGNAISQVFYQKASSIYNQTGDIYRISRNTFLFLFALGLPFALIILFWGDSLFSFVFSSKWKEAGIYSQILIFWVYIGFILSSLSYLPIILKKFKLNLIYSICANFLPIVILYIITRLNSNAYIALSSFSGLALVIAIFQLFWYFQLIRKKSTSPI